MINLIVIFFSFQQKNPFKTAGSFSKQERSEIKSQKITRLSKILPILKEHNLSLMFDLHLENSSHPFQEQKMAIVEEEIKAAQFDIKKVIYFNISTLY